MAIKEIVKDTTAHFVEFKKGNLWYVIFYSTPLGTNTNISAAKNFKFPVPIEDVGDGVFKAKHKSMELMRYVRLHLKTIENDN